MQVSKTKLSAAGAAAYEILYPTNLLGMGYPAHLQKYTVLTETWYNSIATSKIRAVH